MTIFVDRIEFHVLHCGVCKVPFALTESMHASRLKTRDWFWCPNGHKIHFLGKTKEKELEEQVQRLNEMLSASQQREEKMRVERDQISRSHRVMRTRVMNGVCPCCNRTFQNLLRHMKTEHAGEYSLRNIRSAYGMTQGQLAKEIGVKAHHISITEGGKRPARYAEKRIAEWIDRQGVAKV